MGKGAVLRKAAGPFNLIIRGQESIPSSSSSAPSDLSFPISNSIIKPSSGASHSFCHGETCRKQDSMVREDKRAAGSCRDSNFGTVPSQIEVKNAISALQELTTVSGMNASDQNAIAARIIHETSSPGSGLNWVQSLLFFCDPRILQSHGYRRICDAFRLLRAEPSVQKMVVSLSTDKAVWDAIMNNKAVQELRVSHSAEERPQSSNEEPGFSTYILSWILHLTKATVMELIEKFKSLVNEIFQPPDSEKHTAETKDTLEEKLRSSVLLSVVILLIVVVTRFQRI
ncbi:uncharacterized protein LOC131165976 [Malania oleifera]|uniref:uncharacterized protein LOC131165976 n=1 Tax=Malania oleifera TaxID=397392 RepID=UPI0025AEAEE4|nr:uncharacterized protein LOC131165976 [Malania oleifera]